MTNEDWINMFINKFNESKDYKITDIRDREKLLDELRPTGEWERDDEHSIAFDIFKCSHCGGWGATYFRFCPLCGAKMKGGAK